MNDFSVLGYTKVFNENNILLYEKVRCAFDDEYNEKRDMTPVRELKIHQDKIGQYVIHRHKRYYIKHYQVIKTGEII